LPIWRILKSTEIRLELGLEDLQRSRLSDSIRSYKPEDFAGTRRWQAMELERVGVVSMNRLGLQVRWQVDNLNRFKGTLLHADTTTNTKRFVNLRRLVGSCNFDTKLSHSNDGTCFLALLTTLLRLALVQVDNGDSSLLHLNKIYIIGLGEALLTSHFSFSRLISRFVFGSQKFYITFVKNFKPKNNSGKETRNIKAKFNAYLNIIVALLWLFGAHFEE